MARETKAQTIARLEAELRDARDCCRVLSEEIMEMSPARVVEDALRQAGNLREAVAEHAEDAARWRERAERLREARDRLRFALDVVRERDELRAAKGGASWR